MRYDLRVASEYSYFAPAGNFFSLFELFDACFVLRQRKTATVSIEFSKEVLYAERGNQTQTKVFKAKSTQRKPRKKLEAHTNKIACGALGRKKKSPAAKQTPPKTKNACGEKK